MVDATTTTTIDPKQGSVIPETKEAPKTEPVIEVKPPEPKKEVLSPQYEAFAKKERAIVKARQEISAMKAEIQRERDSFKAEMAEYHRLKTIRDNAKIDPDSFLREGGITYGSLTERNMNGGLDPQAIIERTNQTINQFKQEQEDAKKAQTEAQKQQAQREYQESLARFSQSTDEYIEQNKETYELISLNDSQQLVKDVVLEAGRRGQEMTIKRAADKVEEYLQKQIEKTLTTSKKFKDKYAAPKVEEAPKPGAPTLNNTMTSGTQTIKKHRTDQERIDAAMVALNKTLGEQ